jgi:Conserved hypothetical ATP binding protein
VELLPDLAGEQVLLTQTLAACLPVAIMPLLQIELYSHASAIRSLVDWLRADGWAVAAVFCMDVGFAAEPAKYIAGAMQARRCVLRLCLCVGRWGG